MARRRRGSGRKKSAAEIQLERRTWALLLLVVAVAALLPETQFARLPAWFMPVAGALILLGSAMIQYQRRWRVNPVTWIGGAVMLFFALYTLVINPTMNFLGPAIIVIIVVIGYSLLTGEA